MTANRIILISVLLYIILVGVAYIVFLNQKFTGSDAAGNGMAKGLTFFYGLGALFILAIVLTIVNAFFFKGITLTWIKFIFFIPIALPPLILGIMALEIGRPKQVSIEKQIHSLQFEIRTTENLENPTFYFRTSQGSSNRKLKHRKIENGLFVYEYKRTIFYEKDREFYIESDGYATPEYGLEIPYKPKNTTFTNWIELNSVSDDAQDTIKIEFRYRIVKFE